MYQFSSYLEAITTDNDVLPKLMFLTTPKKKSCQIFQFITDDFVWTTLINLGRSNLHHSANCGDWPDNFWSVSSSDFHDL
jgi:hypothetical protein